MVLPEWSKSRVRVHMGAPVLGVQDSGFSLGYRFTSVMGLLEYRLNNLQPWEWAALIGAPTAAASLQGTPQVGGTVSVTINATAYTYTITADDVASETPVLSVAQNVAAYVQAQTAGAYTVSAQPAVSYPVTAIGATLPFWQLAVVSNTGATFTLAIACSGTTYGIATYQGIAPKPSYTFTDDGVTATGYIAICDYLESKTGAASDLSSKYAVADVVTFRRDELAARDGNYQYWRQRLAEFFGIPLYPMPAVGAFGGSGTGLVI